MNIGILTHHWVYNFGANLQTLSTLNFIRKAGHTPFVINWIPADVEKSYQHDTTAEQADCFRKFQDRYFPLTTVCRDSREIAEVINKYHIDRVMIGSDTVFKLRKPVFSFRKMRMIYPTSNAKFPNAFWGDFLNYGVSPSVVAYSAATIDTNPSQFDKEKSAIGEALRRFQRITVRDHATAELIQYFTNGELNPPITPDPVFGFNNNVDGQMTKADVMERFGLPEHYYLIGFQEAFESRAYNWAKDVASYIKQRTNVECFELPRQTGRRLLNINQINEGPITPLEWYSIIRFSNGFIGQLMHPIVSAMHNSLPFYSLDYYGIGKYKRLKIDYKTSKVYQIVKQADMLYRYCHVGARFDRLPNHKEVVDAFLTDDNNKRIEWSRKMAELSKNTMKDIILGESNTK